MDTKPLSPSTERKRLTEAQIDKLRTAFGASLRKANPFSSEAQELIEQHWDELHEDVVEANIASITKILERIRDTITIEVKPQDLQYDLGLRYVWAEDFVEGEIGTFRLTFEEFPKGEELCVRCEERNKRSRNKKGMFGTLAQAQALVREQDKIPVKYRGKVWFLFIATVMCEPGPDRHRRVAVVDWDGARWFLRWHWPDIHWRYNRHRCRDVRALKHST